MDEQREGQVDVKQVYWEAARAVVRCQVTLERAALDMARYLGVDQAKAHRKIEKRVDELRRLSEPEQQGGAVSGTSVAADFDKAREGGGEAVSGEVVGVGSLPTGDVTITVDRNAELVKQLSFVGLPKQGTAYPDVEVDIAVAGVPLEERVRCAVEGQADSCHAPLALVDVVISAFMRRDMAIEKWNAWSPERRVRVVEAELDLLRTAAEDRSRVNIAARGLDSGSAILVADGGGVHEFTGDGSTRALSEIAQDSAGDPSVVEGRTGTQDA